MSKTVYQFDNNGYFLYETEADESPLQPNVFLFPKNTTETKPPRTVEGKIPRWNGINWTIESLQTPDPIEKLSRFFIENPDVWELLVQKVERHY